MQEREVAAKAMEAKEVKHKEELNKLARKHREELEAERQRAQEEIESVKEDVKEMESSMGEDEIAAVVEKEVEKAVKVSQGGFVSLSVCVCLTGRLCDGF